MSTRRPIPILLLLAVGLAGCSKTESSDTTKDEPSPSAAKSVDGDSPAPVPTPAAKPEFDPRTRLFSCESAGWEGEGEERQAKLVLTNLSKRPVKRVQSWIYYYDKDDKQIDRYPHALGAEFKPEAEVEKLLGSKGEKIDPKAVKATCEITSATWEDGEEWQNQNLVYNGHDVPRPFAGQTDEQLIARTGEKVSVTWKGNLDSTGKFTLKNTTDRPLMIRTLWIYYYNAAGKQLDRTVANLRDELAPGASIDRELGREATKLKKGTAVIEGGVSRVDFKDDAGGSWLNRNQAAFERTMKAKPTAPAP